MAAKLGQYVDLRGNVLALSGLSKKERAVVDRLQALAAKNPEWHEYHNAWMEEMRHLCTALGISRREMIETIVYRLGQDLGGRLGIGQGKTRLSDYRDELEQLILTRFPTRRQFCEATGLSEDMLSHVLARRKHLAIDTLNAALEKIGYTLHISPLPQTRS
jgi:hypothetical protein